MPSPRPTCRTSAGSWPRCVRPSSRSSPPCSAACCWGSRRISEQLSLPCSHGQYPQFMADPPAEPRPRTPLPRSGAGKPPLPNAPGGPARRMPRMPGSRMFWIIVLGLLALNYLSVALFAPGKAKSVRIPYSPAFIQEVTNSNVKRVNTQGATVQGEFKKAIRYPDSKADPASNFTTEIPSFVIYNGSGLTNLLTSKNVEIAAEPINNGRGFLYNLVLGFGPV